MEEFTFSPAEFKRIGDMLRAVYAIRTVDSEEDELLGDFIEALDNADVIYCEEEEDEVLDLGPFQFPFMPR